MSTDIQRPEHVPAIARERLPYHPAIQERFGIDRSQWRALVEAIFPNATEVASVILALSYCKARRLDPFKRNVHLVPIWNSQLRRMIDTVWPGIGELRTTAIRTGQYAGRDHTETGPMVTEKIGSIEVTYPEWAQVTVYRLVAGQRVAFAGPRVYWKETYAERGGKDKDPTPNAMWAKRPLGQLDKCAEAAALRAAFPEEVGNEITSDEVNTRYLQEHSPPHVQLEGSRSDQLATLLSDETEQSIEVEEVSDNPLLPAEGEDPVSYVQRIKEAVLRSSSDQLFLDVDSTVGDLHSQGYLTETQVSSVIESINNRSVELATARERGQLV